MICVPESNAIRSRIMYEIEYYKRILVARIGWNVLRFNL